MAFIQFYLNPRTYLATHKMFFAPGGQLTPAEALGIVPNGGGVHGGNVMVIRNPSSMLMAPHAAYPTGIQGLIRSVQQKTVWYGPNPGVGIPGFAKLPWNDDTVVYCDITAAVPAITMIVTGPLTGCHLTAFRVPAMAPANAGHLIFMHTNAALLPGIATTNAMRNHVMNLLGAPAGTPHADCRWGVEYHGQGFAFTQANGAHVDFYVHYTPVGGGRSVTNRWAHL